ncbi:hypothetical protein J1614_010555 [Plenodomus biglobosus]|nr:hypothetical protein J1614_010555 [Plenodomus biglobosus]
MIVRTRLQHAIKENKLEPSPLSCGLHSRKVDFDSRGGVELKRSVNYGVKDSRANLEALDSGDIVLTPRRKVWKVVTNSGGNPRGTVCTVGTRGSQPRNGAQKPDSANLGTSKASGIDDPPTQHSDKEQTMENLNVCYKLLCKPRLLLAAAGQPNATDASTLVDQRKQARWL